MSAHAPTGLAAVGRLAAATAVLLALTACASTPEEAPAGTAPPSVTTTPTTPEPATTPAPGGPQPEEPPALGIGGRIGDHPVNAPADDVVASLTELWGEEPEVTDAETACVTSGLPGRRLVWPGLTVLVRTTDETDADVEPYVAGWALDQHTGTSPLGPLRTEEGLALGDPAGAVTEAYPDAEEFETPDRDMTLWALGTVDGDHTDDLTVYATDDVVTTITGGQACGD